MPKPLCTCGQPLGDWDCCWDGINYRRGRLSAEEITAKRARRMGWHLDDPKPPSDTLPWPAGARRP